MRVSARMVLALLSCIGLLTDVHAADRIVVMTSYPEEVFSRFEAAFERSNPDVNVEFVWRMPHDALPYLREKAQGSVDVYWAAAYRNFVTLKAEGAWRAVEVDRSQVPGRVGPFQLSDPDRRFEAVEMAGFGLVANPAYLAERGLPVPGEWSDIADPRYSGVVLLPIPSRVGFAPNMIDTILQAHGWQEGWSLVSRIASNSRLLDAGSSFVTDELSAGRAGVGLTIDFFARSAIANGAPLAFAYPSTGGYSFAHAAVLRDAPNVSGAERFVRFLTSIDGQALLSTPDIRKLPIRPDAYTSDVGHKNPFAELDSPSLRYDPDLGTRRSALVSALFDRMITQRHEALRSAWATLTKAERDTALAGSPDAIARLVEARRLLEALPVGATEAGDPKLLAVFDQRRRDPQADAAAKEYEAAWTAFLDRNAAQATRVVEYARASLATR